MFEPRMMTPPPRSSRASHGFTLLEVLLAITIFAICILAIYTAFRTAGRSFENGRRSAEQMQTVRFTLDQIARDLRAIYYETDYNTRFYGLERFADQNPDAVLQKLNDMSEKSRKADWKGDDPSLGVENIGAKSNLHFKGENNGGKSSVEFAHFVPADSTSDNTFLGAERVRYYLSGTDLYRQRSRVVEPMEMNPNILNDLANAKNAEREARRNSKSNSKRFKQYEEIYRGMNYLSQMPPDSEVRYYVPVQDQPLPPEMLAKNVTLFEVRYGYFTRNEWVEVDNWDSELKEYRSPPFNIDPDDPNFPNKMMAYEVRPPDNLPSYIRIRVTIGDQTGLKNKSSTVQTMVWLPSSSENYVPTDETFFSPESKLSTRHGGQRNSTTN